jgi:hypothetical protein
MAMIEKKLARKNMSTEINGAFRVICLVLLGGGNKVCETERKNTNPPFLWLNPAEETV